MARSTRNPRGGRRKHIYVNTVTLRNFNEMSTGGLRVCFRRPLLQRLIQIPDQIVDRLEADRQAHDVIASPRGDSLLVGELPVRGRGGVQDQASRVADVCRCENRRTPSTSLTPASNPPLTPKVNTAPAPFGRYFSASL